MGKVHSMLSPTLATIAAQLPRPTSRLGFGEPLLGDVRHERFPITPLGVHPFESADPESDRRVAAVDGGNLEVWHTPNLSLHLCRMGLVIFAGGQRQRHRRLPRRYEFLALTRAVPASEGRLGQMDFVTQIFPLREGLESLLPQPEFLRFDSQDRELSADSSGGGRADISALGGVARRFAEWRLLQQVARHELDGGDLLLRDGTLAPFLSHELAHMGAALEVAQERNIDLVAVAKTCQVLTTTGLPLVSAMTHAAAEAGARPPWVYAPLLRNRNPDHPAAVVGARLHPSSRYTFRVEVANRSEHRQALSHERIVAVLSPLAAVSGDLAFPGYPYPLVVADREGRVEERERGLVRAMARTHLVGHGQWQEFEPDLRAIDAHDRLDRQPLF